MSITKILTTLEHLEKIHKSLLSLAYDKAELIKNGDMEALDELLKGEQAHLAGIVQMETQRQKAVTDYLKDQGRSISNGPTLTELMRVVPEEDRKSLEEAKDRLLHAIHELKWQNELNQKLTYQSLQFVNLSLDMVRPQTESVNYTQTEVQGMAKSIEKRSFDSKA